MDKMDILELPEIEQFELSEVGFCLSPHDDEVNN